MKTIVTKWMAIEAFRQFKAVQKAKALDFKAVIDDPQTDLSVVEQLRAEFLNNKQVLADLEKLKSYSKKPAYELTVALVERFMYNPLKEDLVILARYFNTMDEQVEHRHIANISYMVASMQTRMDPGQIPPLVFTEQAKVAFAATLVNTYRKLFGYTRTQTKMVELAYGASIPVGTTFWIAAKHPIPPQAKLRQRGISFEKGQVIHTQIKAKGGTYSRKLTSADKNVLRTIASAPMWLADDINYTELVNVIVANSSEFAAIREGRFIDDPKNELSKLVKKQMIIDKLKEVELAYREDAEAAKLFRKQQQILGFPLYLTAYYDFRGRVYYEVVNRLLAINGKYGKYLWVGKPRHLVEADRKWLTYAIYSVVHGKCSVKTAEENFNYKLDTAAAVAKEASFVEGLYHKRLVKALADFYAGVKNGVLMGRDYTNGGMLHAGLYLRSPQIMLKSNLFEGDVIYDTHQELADSFNKYLDSVGSTYRLSRKQTKEALSQGITAGVSMRSLQKMLEGFLFENNIEVKLPSIEQLKAIVVGVYGPDVLKISSLNKAGSGLYSQERPALHMIARDGFKFASTAYIAGKHVKVYYPSPWARGEGTSLPTITIARHMPPQQLFIPGAKGQEGRLEWAYNPALGESAKVASFFANGIHGGADAPFVREFYREMAILDHAHFAIHDNFWCAPAYQEYVGLIAQMEVAAALQSHGLDQLDQLVDPTGQTRISNYYKNKEIPNLPIGQNFLQAPKWWQTPSWKRREKMILPSKNKQENK